MTTAKPPKQATILMIEPKLWGSFILSRNITDSLSSDLCNNSPKGVYLNLSASATMPCRRSAHLILNSSFSATLSKGI
jgi:hypothetical protein